MKKMNLLYKSISLALFASVVLLSACKKDELASKELLVYVSGEYGAANNSITTPLVFTPIAVWGSTNYGFPVYATRELTTDLNVFVYPDPPLVSQFNTDNKKKCVLLPPENYKMNGYLHTITSGTRASDSLKIEILNPMSLKDTNGYVLPLTLTKIEGEDKGILISSNRATAYLYIPYVFTNVDTVQTPLGGAAMSRTGWTVTVSQTQSGSPNTAMIDGNNATSWRSTSTSAAKYAILNMGTQQTIKAFQFVPNYVNTNENATQITVSTSTDNITWKAQGIWKGTGPATGSTAAAPDIKGINFLLPVQAQYFRFDFNVLVSGSRVGVGELNALQQ